MKCLSELSRRKFIKWTSLLGATLTFQGSVPTLAQSGPEITLRSAYITGHLSDAQLQQLFGVYQHLENLFGRDPHLSLARATFDEIIHLKTSQMPSYLTEYRTALKQLGQRKERNEADAMETFFNVGEGHRRRYLLLEFTRLYLVYGGFRILGFENYRGHMGGPFAPPNPLPYRGAGA